MAARGAVEIPDICRVIESCDDTGWLSVLLAGARRATDSMILRSLFTTLGRVGDPQADEFILGATTDNRPEVRAAVAEALGEISDPRVIPALMTMATDPDPEVRYSATVGMGRRGDPAFIGALIERLRGDVNTDVRQSAVEMLGRIRDPGVVPPLAAALADASREIRMAAARNLGYRGDARAIAPLVDYTVGRDDEEEQNTALFALRDLNHPAAVAPLCGLLSDSRCRFTARTLALGVLQALGDSTAVPALVAVLRGDTEMQGIAAYYLGRWGDPQAIDPLLELLLSPDRQRRIAAGRAFGNLFDTRAIAPIRALLAKPLPLPDELGLRMALVNLGYKPEQQFDVLARYATDNDWRNRTLAVTMAWHRDHPRAIKILLPRLRDEYRNIRRASARALAESGDTQAITALAAALAAEDSPAVIGAHRLFIVNGDDSAIPALLAALDELAGGEVLYNYRYCGNPILAEAARRHAARHRWPLDDDSFPAPQWGSREPAQVPATPRRWH